jgi:hypothetical protein
MISEKSLGLVGILNSHFGNEKLEIGNFNVYFLLGTVPF